MNAESRVQLDGLLSLGLPSVPWTRSSQPGAVSEGVGIIIVTMLEGKVRPKPQAIPCTDCCGSP